MTIAPLLMRGRRGLQRGLVGHWTMDTADYSGTTVYDRSGYGRHGTSSATPVTGTGKIKEAFDCGASVRYITYPEVSFSDTDPFTIAVWFNAAATGKMIWSYNVGWTSFIYPGTSIIYIRGNGGTTVSFSVGTINTGTWYHLIMTRSATTKKGNVYLNGIVSSSGEKNVVDSFKFNSLGQYAPSSSRWSGLLDDARIYNRVLSVSEIAALASRY